MGTVSCIGSLPAMHSPSQARALALTLPSAHSHTHAHASSAVPIAGPTQSVSPGSFPGLAPRSLFLECLLSLHCCATEGLHCLMVDMGGQVTPHFSRIWRHIDD